MQQHPAHDDKLDGFSQARAWIVGGHLSGSPVKFIHASDLHITTESKVYGLDPRKNLIRFVEDVNARHADADLCVISGDLTDDGAPESFGTLRSLLAELAMPVQLMIGNHDNREAYNAVFQPGGAGGFAQARRELAGRQLIFLDTHEPGREDGRLCPARLAWLRAELEATSGDVFLFMHHPPVDTGVAAIDALGLSDRADLLRLLDRFSDRIRRLFFGHCHLNVFGTVGRIAFSGVRGTNHQVYPDLDGRPLIGVCDLAPSYVVTLVCDARVASHYCEVGASPEVMYVA